MKKFTSVLLSLVLMGAAAFAQEAGKDAKSPKPAGKSMSASHTTPVKDGNGQAEKKPGKMKKDGTPDMRYKENKEAKAKKDEKPAGKMRKDGKPDMRHKENKPGSKPDMKHTENKKADAGKTAKPEEKK